MQDINAERTMMLAKREAIARRDRLNGKPSPADLGAKYAPAESPLTVEPWVERRGSPFVVFALAGLLWVAIVVACIVIAL